MKAAVLLITPYLMKSPGIKMFSPLEGLQTDFEKSHTNNPQEFKYGGFSFDSEKHKF